jgi:hypothetical protein
VGPGIIQQRLRPQTDEEGEDGDPVEDGEDGEGGDAAGNLLPVVAVMAAGGPYTCCGCQRHRLTQHDLSQDPYLIRKP